MTKYYLVTVTLHNESLIEPDEVLSCVTELLKPIDAHDPNVVVLELKDVMIEGRSGGAIYRGDAVLPSGQSIPRQPLDAVAVLAQIQIR